MTLHTLQQSCKKVTNVIYTNIWKTFVTCSGSHSPAPPRLNIAKILDPLQTGLEIGSKPIA